MLDATVKSILLMTARWLEEQITCLLTCCPECVFSKVVLFPVLLKLDHSWFEWIPGVKKWKKWKSLKEKYLSPFPPHPPRQLLHVVKSSLALPVFACALCCRSSLVSASNAHTCAVLVMNWALRPNGWINPWNIFHKFSLFNGKLNENLIYLSKFFTYFFFFLFPFFLFFFLFPSRF